MSVAQLLSLPRGELERLDVALLNMLCAQALPGAERLDVDGCLCTLDTWANAVRRYVDDGYRQFRRSPADYFHDLGFFCFLSMVTLLKHPRGIGVRYQPTAIGSDDFSDSRDDFLHGLLTRKLGTCASLPVLFVAIGRRLGWPMHLAVAKRHVLCQWVAADGTRRNLEGSCPGGGDMYPDEHYHRWPAPLTRDELASGRYLRPLTAAESLALFLETRGHCLVDNRRFKEAREAYAMAHRVAPQWSQYDGHLHSLALHEAQQRRGRGRSGLPNQRISVPDSSFGIACPS
jgi:hypothetical protein